MSFKSSPVLTVESKERKKTKTRTVSHTRGGKSINHGIQIVLQALERQQGNHPRPGKPRQQQQRQKEVPRPPRQVPPEHELPGGEGLAGGRRHRGRPQAAVGAAHRRRPGHHRRLALLHVLAGGGRRGGRGGGGGVRGEEEEEAEEEGVKKPAALSDSIWKSRGVLKSTPSEVLEDGHFVKRV